MPIDHNARIADLREQYRVARERDGVEDRRELKRLEQEIRLEEALAEPVRLIRREPHG